jgi:hypothetical protein
MASIPSEVPSAEAKAEPPKPAPSQPALLPLPPTPAGADPAHVELAASICAAAVIPDLYKKGRVLVGCRSHPPFDRPEQKPDGALVTGLDPLTVCTIDEVYRGSFTRPGAKQAVIAFGQCKEDEATWDMGNPGSAVVVEESAERWKVVAYEPDVNAIGCLTDHRADGRDILVCQTNFAALSSGGMKWFFSLDFAREPKKRNRQLAKMFFDDFTINCKAGIFPPEFLGYGVTSVRIMSFDLADANKDGKQDLVVKVQRAYLPASKTLETMIQSLCKRGADLLTAGAYLPSPTEHTLELVSDGNTFVPTPATQQKLNAWKAAAPESWYNMR